MEPASRGLMIDLVGVRNDGENPNSLIALRALKILFPVSPIPDDLPDRTKAYKGESHESPSVEKVGQGERDNPFCFITPRYQT